MSDNRRNGELEDGAGGLRSVERTDAHEPLEDAWYDGEVVIDASADLSPEIAAEMEAAALLDAEEAAALLAVADVVDPGDINDRTAAQDAPSELFAEIPDPETQPLFAHIPDPEEDPVPRPITQAHALVEERARFQQAPTEYRMAAVRLPIARPVAEVEVVEHRPPPVDEARRTLPPPLPSVVHRVPARTDPPVVEEPSVVLDRALDNELTGIFEPVRPTAAPMRGRLLAVGGASEGKTWYLNRAATTIGRGTDNDVVALDISVSRKHLRIERHDDGFRLIDLDSANGTFVNGRRATRCELFDGDRIEVGEMVLEYSTVGTARVRQDPEPARVTDPGIALPQSPPPRRVPVSWLVVWSLTTFAAVLAAMTVTRYLLREDDAPRGVAPAERPEADARAWLDRADKARLDRDWRQARQDLEVARRLAPSADLPVDALRALIEKEEAQERALNAARTRLDDGAPDEAEALLAEIGPDSPFAADAQRIRAQARDRRRELKVEQAEKALGRGQSEAARLLAEQVLAEDAADVRARAIVEAIRLAERTAAAAAAAETPAEKPIEKPAARPEPREEENDETQQARREMSLGLGHYKKERFADAVVAYERAARRPVSRRLRDQAQDRARWVSAFADAWRNGQKAAADRRAEEAVRQLEAALDLDRKLGGYFAGRIREKMVDPYYFQAIQAFSRRNYGEAARRTRQVLAIDPRHGLASRLNEKIDATARQLLSQAREIGRSDPRRARTLAETVVEMSGGSGLRQEAQALLREMR